MPLGKKNRSKRRKLPCRKIRIFDCPAVSDFTKKLEVTVLAPNHGGDPLGSILGPMGSHWVKKMGQNREKLPCRKIWIFDYPAVIHFSQNMGDVVMAPKSWWGPPRVHLGANGVPLDKKMGQNHEKLPGPKSPIFDYPAVIEFSQKMEVTVMAPNHSGAPIGSILGPMGSHWVQKMGQNSKKLPCPKIWIFDYPAVIDFSQKMEFTVMPPKPGGDSLGAILGPMGSHWVQKMGQNVENYHAPKFEFSTTSRSSIFPKKWKLR